MRTNPTAATARKRPPRTIAWTRSELPIGDPGGAAAVDARGHEIVAAGVDLHAHGRPPARALEEPPERLLAVPVDRPARSARAAGAAADPVDEHALRVRGAAGDVGGHVDALRAQALGLERNEGHRDEHGREAAGREGWAAPAARAELVQLERHGSGTLARSAWRLSSSRRGASACHDGRSEERHARRRSAEARDQRT